MTIEEFDNKRFGNSDAVEYKGEIYNLRKVDFEERLFGLIKDGEDPDDITWIRCENAELIIPF